MEPKKILSANLLDIIFDERNKEYGAYELRVTYPERIKKSLLITFTIGMLAFTAAALATSLTPKDPAKLVTKEITLTDIDQEKEPEPLPEPEKQPEPQQVQTRQFTEFNIVPEEEVVEPPPTVEELEGARIDLVTKEGILDEGISEIKNLDGGTGIIEEKKVAEPEIWTSVEVDAKYNGNWEKFLLKNLNPNTPGDNAAPAGTYKVIVQFVVDLDGNVSDLKALTSHGYGMEQEAIRVLKKANGWEPAFQNGSHVKAYRRQPVTFVVEE